MKAPTTDLCRFAPFEFEIRSADSDGFTLEGYAAVFNSPTIIDSWEGRFEETIMPGSFRKTLSERTPVMQFDHGKHPLIGSIPLGVIQRAAEDSKGVHIKARLSDNWLIEPVRIAIRDKAVNGMSFRMAVIKDAWTGGDIERRAIHEVAVPELGPVVFPAYTSTEVGVRSEFDNDLPTLLEARMTSHFATDLSTSHTEPADEATPIEEAGVTHEPREHSVDPSNETADAEALEAPVAAPSTLASRRQMARIIEARLLGVS
jgi:HK97 family phage prohead protease